MNDLNKVDKEYYGEMLKDLVQELARAHGIGLTLVSLLEETQLDELQQSIVRVAHKKFIQAHERFLEKYSI